MNNKPPVGVATELKNAVTDLGASIVKEVKDWARLATGPDQLAN
jgi:hypothetical protein